METATDENFFTKMLNNFTFRMFFVAETINQLINRIL